MSRLYGLDALRGLAAILVMWGHISDLPNSTLFAGNYGLCVDFFLMLSGYVLTRTYEVRMRAGMGVGQFMAKRYWRLFPLAALGAVLALMVIAIKAGGTLSWADWGAFATALLFLPYPEPWLFPVNGPRWSLFFELVMNLLHVTVLCWLSVRKLAIFLVVVAALQIMLISRGWFWPEPGHAAEFVPGSLRMIVSYTIGILLWRCAGERPLVVLRLPVLIGCFVAMVVFGTAFKSGTAGLVSVFVICPILLLGGVSYRPSARLATWCAALGAVSYPVYALHGPLMWLAEWAALPPPQIMVLALSTVGAAICGVVWWHRSKAAQPALAAVL